MAASTSKSEIETYSDKNLTNFDEKTSHDLNKFPVNFSGVPHIGQKIFGNLDFEDLHNCRTVCKGWHNFLEEKRSLWIELLEKEKIKLERSENYDSDDSFSSDDIPWWEIHKDEHDPDNVVCKRKDFFAVAVGHEVGIFPTWDQCKKQVNGYPGNKFQGFYIGQEAEAQAYLNSYAISFVPLEPKYMQLRLKREEKMEDLKANHAGWFWLIEKVKKGPISDMICLIPKIRHVDLFGDIFEAKHVTECQQDYLSVFKLMLKHDALLSGGKTDFLTKAIQAKNVEMVKFIAPKIKASQFSTESYVQMVEHFRKMAKQSGNKEILEFINSWIDSGSDDSEELQDSSENSEEEN